MGEAIRRCVPERRAGGLQAIGDNCAVSDADFGMRLLEYLRARLREPALAYAEEPTRVSGGFDTRIFAFRLRSALPAYAGPLILRLLGPHDHPARALREAVTQNTLAELGYPAPRVLLASADVAPLGGAFLVMERLPGKALTEAGPITIGRVLVEMQSRLHALDADVLLRALEREDRASTASSGLSLDPGMMTRGGQLAQLERRIARGSLDGLGAGMAWLVARRPPEPERRVICHGDFHPYNILVSGTTVTGVIDWPNAVVADAACDVASTKSILSLAPLDMLEAPWALRWLIRGLRPVMINRYLAGYQRSRPLDSSALAYYEAFCCMRLLVRTAENRLRPGALNPLDASSFGDVLAVRFARLTGISPMLPPVKRIPGP
jgi:aminoglycoside phosphotransferase (APT) family kinase protein